MSTEILCLGTSCGQTFCQYDLLATLFAWIVGSLKRVPSVKAYVPNSILLELVRKCLSTAAHSNRQLMDAAIPLTKLMDDSSLMEKVKKLSHVIISNSIIANSSKKKRKSFIANYESSLPMTSLSFHKMEEDMCQAARKLELFKQQVMKSRTSSTDCGTDKPRTWTLAKEWNPCPIGLLPRIAGPSGHIPSLDHINIRKDVHDGPSGYLPSLDHIDNKKDIHDGPPGYLPSLDHIDDREDIHELDGKKTQKLRKCGVKRDASLDLMLLDKSAVKKRRKTRQVSELDHDVSSPSKAKKCLILNVICKSFTEEEFRAIKSSARMLV